MYKEKKYPYQENHTEKYTCLQSNPKLTPILNYIYVSDYKFDVLVLVTFYYALQIISMDLC